MKKAFITGVTGQDGSYLTELLLAKGYEVHGLIRRASTFNTSRLSHIYQDPHENNSRLVLHYGDMADGSRLTTLLSSIEPDEIYNLAAQSHVRVSFDEPVWTGDVTALGTTRMLESVRESKISSRIYQASSSEMFGSSPAPQNENTPFSPRSPYGAAKLYSHWMIKNFREAHGIFAVSGVLFNHESPRRGETFVTRKITRGVAAIQSGQQKELYLGNLQALRDWGYAPDYVVAMWRMLQLDEPDDFVIGTGESTTVEDFLDYAFSFIGLDWHDFVKFDPRYLRPTEVDHLEADASKAKVSLGWKNYLGVRELAELMVQADIEKIKGQTVDKPQGPLWTQETN